ncbi:tyrosine-type recombinase/integrase [bacterium]|nr:tyrosine-type recombinase/integrase [bacterium]
MNELVLVGDDSQLEGLFLQGLATGTIESYQRAFSGFHDVCGKPWTEVNYPDFVAYYQYLQERGDSSSVSANTMRLYLCAVKSMITFLEKGGLRPGGLSWLCGRLIRRIPDDRADRPKYVSVEKTWEIIDREPQPLRKLFIEFLYLTAMRVSEALQFRLDGVIVEDGRRFFDVRRKGGRMDRVEIPAGLVERLRSLGAAPDGRMFPFKRGWAHRFVKAAGARCGVPEFSPHWNRHGHCTHALMHPEVNIGMVMKQAGHTSLKHTTRYLHPEQSSAEFLQRDISPV